jgi:MFS superfamily sulfate permease-like transporter
VSGLIGLWRINRIEFWVATTTAVLGLTVGLLAAVGFGVVATLVLVLREVNRPAVEALTEVEPGLWVSERVAGEHGTPPPDGVLVVTAEHGLYAANTRANCEAVLALAVGTATRRDVSSVVLDLRRQSALTTSVLKGLQDLDHELAARSMALYLSSVTTAQLAHVDRVDWVGRQRRAGRIFDDVSAAVQAATAGAR